MKLLVIAAACLLAVYSVAGSDGDDVQVVEKRAVTIGSISSKLAVGAGVMGNVMTLIGLTSAAIPLMGVFTGLFALVGSLLSNEKDFWEKLEKRMEEIAHKEVTDYHDIMRSGFIKNIKNSLKLYERFPEKHNGNPNQQKITQGTALSGDINNNKQLLNLQLGKNPQEMITYYMEVVSIDIALLYSMAAVYGPRDRNHWITLDERLKTHIADAEKGARDVLNWKMKSEHFKCETASCNSGRYEACGLRGGSRCAIKTTCATGKDLTHPMEKRVSYRKRPSGTAYKIINDYYSKTKKASNCDWFRSEVKKTTENWLKTNVYAAVSKWKDLKNRASRALGR